MIEAIDGAAAWKIAAKNKLAKYPKVDQGRERLLPYASPYQRPTFEISKSAKIFTIGSCFAREVDIAMVRAGFDVISRSRLPADILAMLGGSDAVFNKYTAHSMLNELQWALDPEYPFPGDEAFVEAEPGKFVDLQLGGFNLNMSLEDTRKVRDGFTNAMRSAQDADVFIATFGLAETWYDKAMGIYLNVAPSLRLCQRYPNRFEFRVLGYEDIYASITEIYKTVKRFGKPDVKFLFTVSPVALLSTFRDQDVIVANTYSKAVQRTALESFVMEHDDVDYFPSYEAVTMTPTMYAWSRNDFRHVNPYMVRRIMGSVLSAYTDEEIILNTPSEEIMRLHKEQDLDGIIQASQDIDLASLEWKAAYAIGIAHKRKRDWIRALEVFNRLRSLYPGNAHIIKNAAYCAKILKKPILDEIIVEFEAKFPGDQSLQTILNKKR